MLILSKMIKIVDKMRNMSRMDSGYKDFKMKQHYKFLHDKDEQINDNKLTTSLSSVDDNIQLTNVAPISQQNVL